MLLMEPLESRTLLSQITWDTADHPTGGDWDTGSNWVGGSAPGPSDTAVIDLTGAGTVTHNNDVADTILGLTTNSSTTLSLGNGSINLGFWQLNVSEVRSQSVRQAALNVEPTLALPSRPYQTLDIEER